MKRLLLATAAAFIATSAYAWDLPAMNKQVDQTNFLLNQGCSATYIDEKQSLLLTANHCVQSQFIEVERETIDPDGTIHKRKVRVAEPGTVTQLKFSGKDSSVISRMSYVFTVKANDSEHDLALIQTKQKITGATPAKLACAMPIRGEHIWVVGNSLGRLYATVSDGIVSSVDRDYELIGAASYDERKGPLVQTTAPVAGGNSGGAMYNDKGELFGVTVLGFQLPSPLSIGVPLKVIQHFLKDNFEQRILGPCYKPTNTPASEIGM